MATAWNKHISKALQTAWKQLYYSKILRYFLSPSFGGTVGFLLFWKNTGWFTTVHSILLAIGAFIFLSILLYFRYFIKFLRKKNPQGEYLEVIKRITAEITDKAKDGVISKPDIARIAKFVCNEVQQVFNYKAREETCHVCIKVPFHDTAKHMEMTSPIKNLCRSDGDSIWRDTPPYLGADHRVDNNTCFLTILSAIKSCKKDELFFIENNILGNKNYKTSSDGKYHKIMKAKSELVVPIIPLQYQKPGNGTENDKKEEGCTIPAPIGFLCVDCSKRYVFDDHYDLVLLQWIADSLYDIIGSKLTID